MNLQYPRSARLGLALGLILAWPVSVQAQFFPGQIQGAGGANRSRSATSRQYPASGTIGDAIFSVDPETRSLIIIADDETSEAIAQVVKNLDIARPQVLIKVVFVEVTHSKGSDIGLEGGWAPQIGNAQGAFANAFGMSGLSSASTGSNAPPPNPFGQPTTAFTPMPPGAGLYQVFASEYQVTLRAIAQAGKAKVLSRPSIVARNNQPATITVGQSVPLITDVRFDNFGNAINSVSYESVGIILRVTPFIAGDGMVEMVVSPEISDLEADRSQWVSLSSGGNASAPIINERTADTVVVTPDGQTVIIGGLMQTVKAQAEYKIPLLGDIPLLGNLFKRRTSSDQKTELLIFLTPHIIHAPSEMPAVSERERENSSMKKTFSEDELDKFFDTLPQAEPQSPGSAEPQSGSRRNRR